MPDAKHTTDLHRIRKENLHLLLRDFSETQLANGVPAKGIEGAFAAHLGISAVTLSHMKSARNISDKMAGQLETRCLKSIGWMDEASADIVPSTAELYFLELARSAWRSTNAQGRRQLLKTAKSWI